LPRLFYNNSIYKDEEICDLNPLLIHLYNSSSILVITAREQQCKRIRKRYWNNPKVSAIGCWEIERYGLNKITDFDIVVILDRNRVDHRFTSLVDKVISLVS
jgi:hypothetical protein